MDYRSGKRKINHERKGVEQPGLSKHREFDADIHRVPHEAVKPLHNQSLRRRDRRGRSAPDGGKTPEGGVAINGDSENGHHHRRKELCSRGRNHRMPADEPGHNTNDGSRHERGKEQCFGNGGNVDAHSDYLCPKSSPRQPHGPRQGKAAGEIFAKLKVMMEEKGSKKPEHFLALAIDTAPC